jgi:hypothetical protein
LALIGSRFKDAEFSHRTHRAQPEHTDKFEDTLKADYWKHVARNMRPGDKIEAVWEDNSLYAEYLVLVVMEGGVGAKVALLRKEILVCFDDGVFVDNGTQYKIEFAGNFHKFRIIRVSDGEVVGSKYGSELEARNALHEYRKAMQVNAIAAA